MNSTVILLLEAIAAEAKLLAMQESQGKHWEHELSQGLARIAEKVQRASQEIRRST